MVVLQGPVVFQLKCFSLHARSLAGHLIFLCYHHRNFHDYHYDFRMLANLLVGWTLHDLCGALTVELHAMEMIGSARLADRTQINSKDLEVGGC